MRLKNWFLERFKYLEAKMFRLSVDYPGLYNTKKVVFDGIITSLLILITLLTITHQNLLLKSIGITILLGLVLSYLNDIIVMVKK